VIVHATGAAVLGAGTLVVSAGYAPARRLPTFSGRADVARVVFVVFKRVAALRACHAGGWWQPALLLRASGITRAALPAV